MPTDLVLAYPLTLLHGGPDARGCLKDTRLGGAVSCGLLSLPWTPLTLFALQLWPEDMYREAFGATCGLFAQTGHPGDVPLRAP